MKLALQADFIEDNSVPLTPKSVPVASTVGPTTMVEVSLDRNPGRYSVKFPIRVVLVEITAPNSPEVPKFPEPHAPSP